MGQEEAVGSSMHLPFLQCQENYLFHTDPSKPMNHSFQNALSLLCETRNSKSLLGSINDKLNILDWGKQAAI
jgi:hypothetical protein